MNKSFSKIRHIREANLLMENRRLMENNRSFLMESNQNGIDYELVNKYVSAVKAAMPDYSNAEGLESDYKTKATIFGQLFYHLPLTLPDKKQNVLANLQKIQKIVRGGDPQNVEKPIGGKEREYTCIKRVLEPEQKFPNDSFCSSFEVNNKKNFQNYAAMNKAYDNLYNSINNLQEKTPDPKQIRV